MSIEVKKLGGSIGAVVSGVDLSEESTGEEIEAIRRVWLDHLVVFFREQHLTCDQFLAFARRIGRPVPYPLLPSIDGYPEIIEVLKLEHERVNFGGLWHSDTAYLDEPPMATMLLARQVPSAGGDTLFANGYLAYETLSEGLREILDRLDAVHSSALADVSKTREDRLAGAPSIDYESVHPVIRVHPETQRRSLYVSPAHTARFAGLTEEESRPLLGFLFDHQVRPEFTCRFQWAPGSIALWDNRCALHNPVNDYHGHRRSLHRITMAEDKGAFLH
jgi:alpha-ketoglutarate-dependent taurine dioxygenase